MDSFYEALVSGKTERIPDEYDWFKPLLGDWDCDYYDEYGGKKRHVMKRLCFTKEGDRLKGEVLDEEPAYWVFSDITGDSFRWKYIRIKPDGLKALVCEIVGKRMAE